MYYRDAQGKQVALTLVKEQRIPSPAQARSRARGRSLAPDEQPQVVRAAMTHFNAMTEKPERPHGLPDLPVFRERRSGLLRTVYREIVVRFEPDCPERTRGRILRSLGLVAVRRNPLVAHQFVVEDKTRRRHGASLVDVANRLFDAEEVAFATPNFVSQYRRSARIPTRQWHLRNTGAQPGQRAGEDVDAMGAWRRTEGRGIVVAVIDDGVDVDHPNLRAGIWRNPDRRSRDTCGRDFFVDDTSLDHFDPRPKRFQPPYAEVDFNDIHGTPCAGVVAARGARAWGIAPQATVLPVKIFHADEMAKDEAVANAIRYAALHAHVLSMSWGGGENPDVRRAIDDAGEARYGLGAVCLAASGNDGDRTAIDRPARYPGVIAVGASTDQRRIASYSNRGRQLSVVAPSGGGIRDIYTSDVTMPGRGYNPGAPPAGLETGMFSGTSSATPLAAGIAALVLAVNGRLHRDEVKKILEQSAVKVGRSYNTRGRSNAWGHGRVSASAAVELAAAWT